MRDYVILICMTPHKILLGMILCLGTVGGSYYYLNTTSSLPTDTIAVPESASVATGSVPTEDSFVDRLGIRWICYVIECPRHPPTTQGNQTQGIDVAGGGNVTADALASGLGVGWVRYSLHWPRIESAAGSFDWTIPDTDVAQFQKEHLNVLFVVLGTPCWAAAAQPTSTTACGSLLPNQQAWQSFLTQAVTHYKALGINHWEVWNEPNATNFLQATPEQYREHILTPAITAIRAADPQAFIVAPALAVNELKNNFDQTRVIQMLTGLLGSDATQLDAVSIHAYLAPPNIMSAGSATRNAMSQLGIAGKPLWLTEYGKPSNPGANSSEAQQETHFLAYQKLNALQNLFNVSFWYHLNDPVCLANNTGPICNNLFGLYTKNLSPKPIVGDFKRLFVQ